MGRVRAFCPMLPIQAGCQPAYRPCGWPRFLIRRTSRFHRRGQRNEAARPLTRASSRAAFYGLRREEYPRRVSPPDDNIPRVATGSSTPAHGKGSALGIGTVSGPAAKNRSRQGAKAPYPTGAENSGARASPIDPLRRWTASGGDAWPTANVGMPGYVLTRAKAG